MIAIIAISERGKTIAKTLSLSFSGESRLYFPAKGSLKDLVGKVFVKDRFEGIIFIMALGIVVRLIAPYIKNKYLDPAVVAVDETGRFTVSVISGHEGGANKLAIEIGNILQAEPVITTASESKKNIVVGIGCRKGIKKIEVVKAIKYGLLRAGCSINNVRCVATIDLKRDEKGLRDACFSLNLPLFIVSTDLIKKLNGVYQRSNFVKEKIGVEGVSEPCALLAGRRTKLILPKIKLKGITIAVARSR